MHLNPFLFFLKLYKLSITRFCNSFIKINEEKIKNVNFPVLVKFSLYPLGKFDYIKDVSYVINKSIDMGINAGKGHYVIFLKGNVQDIFKYFEETIQYCLKK